MRVIFAVIAGTSLLLGVVTPIAGYPQDVGYGAARGDMIQSLRNQQGAWFGVAFLACCGCAASAGSKRQG